MVLVLLVILTSIGVSVFWQSTIRLCFCLWIECNWKNIERCPIPGNSCPWQYPLIVQKWENSSNTDDASASWNQPCVTTCHHEKTSKYHDIWTVASGTINVLHEFKRNSLLCQYYYLKHQRVISLGSTSPSGGGWFYCLAPEAFPK